MGNWTKRASDTLVPLSEADRLKAALKEWYYTGVCADFEESCEVCELCGQEHLRYHFEIANHHNKNSMNVGSECIKRFEIPAIDIDGSILNAAKTAAIIDMDRRQLIEDARKRRATDALSALECEHPRFTAAPALATLRLTGAFSPRQTSFLFAQFDQRRIPYRARDFKVCLRTTSEKDELRVLTDEQLRSVWCAMTKAQQKSIWKYKDKVEQYGERWR